MVVKSWHSLVVVCMSRISCFELPLETGHASLFEKKIYHLHKGETAGFIWPDKNDGVLVPSTHYFLV